MAKFVLVNMMIGTLSSGVGSLPTIGPDVGEPPTLPSTIILTMTDFFIFAPIRL